MSREFEIRKEVTLEATPEQVWEAIATGPGLAAWFMAIEAPDRAQADAWDPSKHLVTRTPEAEDGTTHAFEYLIEAREGGSSVLRFVHSGILGDDWSAEYEDMTSHGWDMYLHTLTEYLKHFPGRPATYIEAEGPQASAQASAWPGVLEGLGLSRAPTQGEQVRLTPAGLAPIEGVVDYVGPSFLGVRTADALLRFHGRAALGMAVAVGHHVYSDDVDQAAGEQAWKSWLEGLFA
ncbi:SRPBCC family protein [Pseudonocardia bannensis]|uniref:SRPBCC domain-containing protein n=1 Tax=Pseudonocardia bannensis TaxID=630973 RepID=A0A848DH02_9PSEU|nr:SRPBCC domain-containing protein [Pseudonocardia bannensis]NMH91927.1 SRPBCC domain-containing protein [Pseudonocardia bannensis]